MSRPTSKLAADMVPMTIRIHRDRKRAMKLDAVARDETMEQWLDRVIREALDRSDVSQSSESFSTAT
jgi:hypothetical protein